MKNLTLIEILVIITIVLIFSFIVAAIVMACKGDSTPLNMLNMLTAKRVYIINN
jgi:hypothetical protein